MNRSLREPIAPGTGVPDLHSQLESLLHEIWRLEAEWRFDDRLVQQVRLSSRRLRCE